MSRVPEAVHALLSDILGISAKYSIEILRNATHYVEGSFHGRDREIILELIKDLTRLKGDSVPPPASVETDSHSARERHQEFSPPSREPNERGREIRAVLQDTTFLPTKADVSSFGVRHLGMAGFRPDPKESRSRVAGRVVAAFEKMPEATQTRVYQGIRRAYLKGRRSSLNEWSDIIDKPTGR